MWRARGVFSNLLGFTSWLFLPKSDLEMLVEFARECALLLRRRFVEIWSTRARCSRKIWVASSGAQTTSSYKKGSLHLLTVNVKSCTHGIREYNLTGFCWKLYVCLTFINIPVENRCEAQMEIYFFLNKMKHESRRGFEIGSIFVWKYLWSWIYSWENNKWEFAQEAKNKIYREFSTML